MYFRFLGLIQSSLYSGFWTYLKEIPNTKLLVSLNYHHKESASMAIFDISRKVSKEIYSFEEIFGGKSNSYCINSSYSSSLSLY